MSRLIPADSNAIEKETVLLEKVYTMIGYIPGSTEHSRNKPLWVYRNLYIPRASPVPIK